MELHDVWFVLIAVLWIGYFFLEGFDFGVGVLTKLLARDRAEKRVLINTIGPVWDGNEVWLLTAAWRDLRRVPRVVRDALLRLLPAAADHPGLSDHPGVAFEYRVKRPEENWQRNWERAIFWTSLIPAFLWGVAFANIVRGVKIDADMEYVGGFFELLNPYALLGGLVTLTLFTFHGAVFVSLKTVGDIRVRARALALKLGLVTAVLALGFLIWTQIHTGDSWSLAAMLVAVVALVGAIGAIKAGREGWSFAFSGVTIAAAVAMLFLALFPDVMPSSLDPAWSLTVTNASSSPYTLKIMTWCAAIATPLVLLYQSWTYWVFRKRIGTQHIADAH